MQPNTPFLTPRRAEQWRAEQPSPLPVAPTRPAASLAYRRAIWVLRLVFVLLLVLVLAAWFFLFGEEKPERMRPELTPAQRTRAFRLPRP